MPHNSGNGGRSLAVTDAEYASLLAERDRLAIEVADLVECLLIEAHTNNVNGRPPGTRVMLRLKYHGRELPAAPPVQCVDCSKDADTTCHECGGPWCGECREGMKGRHEHHPCHTCRNGDDW